MKYILQLATLLSLAFATLTATAQNNGSNSPYSRYGYGLLNDGGNAFNKAMGGTAYGFRKGNELNQKNPASYSAIDSLSFLFDFGLTMQNGVFKANGRKIHAQNTAIDYISAGFRLAPRFGMSLGLMPYTSIGYNISQEKPIQTVPTEINQTTTFSGEGGLHIVYLGFGWEPIRNFSIGFNAGYLWGDLSHTVYNDFDDNNINTTQQLYRTDLRSYKIDFGAQYSFLLSKKNKLTLGLTYGLGHDIDRDAVFYDQNIASTGDIHTDTLTARNAYALPHTFGAGVTWEWNKKLRIGVDYTAELWSKAKMPGEITEETNGDRHYTCGTGSLTNRHKVNFGLEYVPNEDALKWHRRIRYRAGFSYATPYTKIGEQDGPRSYQASLGCALPISNAYNNRSLINLSFQYERMQPTFKGMVSEEYFRICLGLSFNERWFMKWKAE